MACFGSVFAGSRQVYFFEETITLSDRKPRNINFLMAEQPGTNVSRIAQDLGLDPSVLRRWVGQMRGRPREVLHHSDQGSQYTSEQFQMLLAEAGIVCSMSKRGDCWDNAAMESVFSTLKTERLSRRILRSRDECRAEVLDYIERFYNARRQHSTLGYVSPMQFEAATC